MRTNTAACAPSNTLVCVENDANGRGEGIDRLLWCAPLKQCAGLLAAQPRPAGGATAGATAGAAAFARVPGKACATPEVSVLLAQDVLRAVASHTSGDPMQRFWLLCGDWSAAGRRGRPSTRRASARHGRWW